MRVCLVWKSLVLILTFGNSVSYAAIRVWHTAKALSANAEVVQQGSTGDSLELRCDKSVGDCQWRITAQLRIEDGTSWSYSLWLRDLAGSATTLSVSQTTLAGSPYSNPFIVDENQPNGFISEIEATTPTTLQASGTVHFMHSFILTKSGQDYTSVTSLKAGSNGFTGEEPTDPGDIFRQVTVDRNGSFAPGHPPGEWPIPVINITNVPEPATLGFLACALVALASPKRRTR